MRKVFCTVWVTVRLLQDGGIREICVWSTKKEAEDYKANTEEQFGEKYRMVIEECEYEEKT